MFKNPAATPNSMNTSIRTGWVPSHLSSQYPMPNPIKMETASCVPTLAKTVSSM